MERKHRLEYQHEHLVQLREAVDVGSVCVVHGATGKTEFIRTVYPVVVLYDSREILEPRNLGGLYVLKDGDLRYVDGILVEAMHAGTALCFGRIDRNTALLQYLRPMISGRRLVATSGALVVAHPHFRLFFTSAQVFPLRNVSFIGPIRFSYDSVIESFGRMRGPVEDALRHISARKALRCAASRGFSCDEICLEDLTSSAAATSACSVG